jgi:hypothetical protein
MGPTTTQISTIKPVLTNRKSKLYIVILIIVISAILIIAVSVAVYIWRDNQANLQNDKNTVKIDELKKEISAIESTLSANSKKGFTVPLETTNTQRKNDVARFMTAISNYQSKNRGALPDDLTEMTTWKSLVDNFIQTNDGIFRDPSGTDYSIIFAPTILPSNFDSTNPTMLVTPRAICNGELLITGQSVRNVSIQMRLEGNSIVCYSN